MTSGRPSTLDRWFAAGSKREAFMQAPILDVGVVWVEVPEFVHPSGRVAVRCLVCGDYEKHYVRPLDLHALGEDGKMECPYPFSWLAAPPWRGAPRWIGARPRRKPPAWYLEAGLWLTTHPGVWAKAVLGGIRGWSGAQTQLPF